MTTTATQTSTLNPNVLNLTDITWDVLPLTTSNMFTSVYRSFAFLLYFAGVLGIVFNYKNFLVTIRSVELIYLGVITSFVRYGVNAGDSRGAIYGLLILILAACESAVGLGIIIVLYRFGRSIDFSSYQNLGG